MSYDLHLWQLDQSVDPLEVYYDEESESRPMRELDRSLREAIVEGLVNEFNGHPGFESHDIGELDWVNEGMQLFVGPEGLGLSMAYWHSGPEATRAIGIARRVLEICRAEAPLTIIDPQIEKAVRPGEALDELFSAYDYGVRATQSIGRAEALVAVLVIYHPKLRCPPSSTFLASFQNLRPVL